MKSLKVSDGVLSPSFNESVTTYSLTVDESVKYVDISATCYNCSELTGLGNFKVLNGTSAQKIQVVSEDGKTTKEYTVFITKKESEVTYDDNDTSTELKKLKVKGYKISPEFNRLNDKYTVIINKDEDKLDIEVEAVSKDATINILGNENLQYKENKITIEVKNNKNEQTYTLIVYKEKKIKKKTVIVNKSNSKKKDKSLIIIIVSISFMIILISWYFIFMHQKIHNKRKIKRRIKKNKKKST